uniref:Uncharacterized protein n=1 Tax=Arundo donax TaxID=35708 RepID=A0A0A9BKQ3_ARUDO
MISVHKLCCMQITIHNSVFT